MMITEKLKNNSFVLYLSVIILILFRLLLIADIPLLDKTEARYAEIARIMWDTNQWIVPQIDYGVPFMAKPPLSTWLSAISYFTFGINEFAARFPTFLLNILILIITGRIVKKTGASFYLPGFILLTMPEFLIHTGVVSTDTAFAFCTSMVMIAFWKTMNDPDKTYWNYIFSLFIGLGLLAKGPLVLMLTLPPIFIWCLLDITRFKAVISKFSILLGLLIITIIAVPWYYFAEQKAPGFLDYFIIGEHYKRFVESGWKGDLYGRPKIQPIGMIWVFMIIFAFPWIQIVCYKLWQNRKTIWKNNWVSFLVLWLFWTPVFFTFSKNILHTYSLPITVPLMFLMVYYWEDFKTKTILFRTALFFPIVVFVFYFSVFKTGILEYKMNTDKYILSQLDTKYKASNIPIYYWKEKNYSGQFYTNGKAQLIKNESEFDSILKINKKIILITLKKSEIEIPNPFKAQLKRVEENYKTAIYISK